MKANHNSSAYINNKGEAVINTSKIQNESKSQPSPLIPNYRMCCYQYIKDTK